MFHRCTRLKQKPPGSRGESTSISPSAPTVASAMRVSCTRFLVSTRRPWPRFASGNSSRRATGTRRSTCSTPCRCPSTCPNPRSRSRRRREPPLRRRARHQTHRSCEASAAASPPPLPPARDPRADDAAIRETLRRYQAAWEALDLAALQRVQALSDDQAERVRATMAGARSYLIEMTVEEVTVDPGGRAASARCMVRRRFQPRSGFSREVPPARETIRFEKRGDAWIITNLQQ